VVGRITFLGLRTKCVDEIRQPSAELLTTEVKTRISDGWSSSLKLLIIFSNCHLDRRTDALICSGSSLGSSEIGSGRSGEVELNNTAAMGETHSANMNNFFIILVRWFNFLSNALQDISDNRPDLRISFYFLVYRFNSVNDTTMRDVSEIVREDLILDSVVYPKQPRRD